MLRMSLSIIDQLRIRIASRTIEGFHLWSAVKAARWYVFLTLVLFVIFLIVYFPAQFALKLAEDALARAPVKFQSVSGTIWNGQGVVSFQRINADVAWSLNGVSLLTLSPEVDVSLQIDRETELAARLRVSNSSLMVNDLTGKVQVSMINPYLKAHRVSGQGIVKLYDLSLAFDHQNKKVESASGRLLWQEAQATYPGPKGIENISLPDIAGRLSSDDKGAVLSVLSGDNGAGLASVFVMNQGWAGLKVRKRSVDLVGQTWVGNQQPDDVIFQVREKLW